MLFFNYFKNVDQNESINLPDSLKLSSLFDLDNVLK